MNDTSDMTSLGAMIIVLVALIGLLLGVFAITRTIMSESVADMEDAVEQIESNNVTTDEMTNHDNKVSKPIKAQDTEDIDSDIVAKIILTFACIMIAIIVIPIKGKGSKKKQVIKSSKKLI